MTFGTQDLAVNKGLNMDLHEALLPENALVYMLNGDISGYENGATAAFVQNVLSNEECFRFPTGYILKGFVKLDKDQYALFFKTPTSSEIGLLDTNTCAYFSRENDPCLNFNGEIKGEFHNKSGCDDRRVYYIEKGGPIRFIDIDECRPTKNANSCFECEKDLVFDCEAYNLNRSITFPQLSIAEGVGNLPNGSYQIAMALTDHKQRFTEYYVYPQIIRFHTNNQANNRFGIDVSFITCPQGFDQYELVLISHRTDRATLAQRIGYFDVEQTSFTISELDDTSYTPIDLQILSERFPRYQSAEDIATNDETLVLKGVTVREQPNYQLKANLIASNWVVKQVKAANAHKHFSYMRGETYAHFIRGVYKDGERTVWYLVSSDAEKKIHDHNLPLEAQLFDPIDNEDNCEGGEVGLGCGTKSLVYWQVYDTSRVTFTDVDPDDSCDGKVIMRGDFGYWESELQYPNNDCVWGQRGDRLEPFYQDYGKSCQKIQYHKFPDNVVTHIHNNATCGEEELVNILGIEFSGIQRFRDKNNVIIDDIIGYEIGVADRSNHKSIIHKGLMYNMFEEKLADCTTSYYANYPFNDLHGDVFLSKTPAQYLPPNQFGEILYTPVDTYSKKRFQYISPDVQYERNDSGAYVQLYAEENGPVSGKFSPTEGMPWNVILSDLALLSTAALGIGLAITLGQSFYSVVDGITTVLQSLRAGLAPVNYALNYFAKTVYKGYNMTRIVPGNIRRRIVQSQYLLPTKMLVGTNKINNAQREQGLFLELCDDFLDPAVAERSRIRFSDVDCDPTFEFCQATNIGTPITSSYYAGIKIERPNQYGLPDSNLVKVATPVVYWNHPTISSVQEIYGGDIYITKHKYIRKMPFFTQLPLGLPNDSQYKLRPYMNVWQVRYWADWNESTSFLAVGNLGANDNRNLEPVGNMRRNFCGVSAANCNQDLFFRVDGKFYTHVVGEAHYWCESEYIGNFRELNEIPESDVERDIQAKIEYRTVQYPEVFLYNRQYHWKGFNVFGPHADPSLDCCRGEQICYENTLAYSRKHDPLSKGDAWSKFYPNSIQQFSGKDGNFTGIKALDQNNLLIFFENAMYTTQQDEFLNTENGRIFLGSPELFSRRLNKVSEDSSGFGGCIDPESIQVTRYGAFYFDRKRKKFLHLGKGLNDVTGNIQSWLQKYLVGPVIGVYDNFTDNLYYTGEGPDGCKWTLSFKPKTMEWVSFHSFTPGRYLPTANNYITESGGALWKHNKQYEYQKYYGVKHPFDVGFVLKGKMQNGTLQDLEVYSEWIKFENYNCKQYDPKAFFNKMLIYNQLLSTGTRDILLKNINNNNHNSVQSRTNMIECTSHGDFTYNLNKFDAYEVDQPLVCGECMGYDPRNALRGPTAMSVGNAIMKGKWFRVHLISDDSTNHKILLQLNVAKNAEIAQ